MRVLHVSQASSGGVLTALTSLVRSQIREGVDATVLLVLRADSPSSDDLAGMFGPEVELRFLPRGGMNLRTAGQMAWALVPLMRNGEVNFFHYHSTFAGAVGRVTSRLMKVSARSFYSPHGFAFRTGRVNRIVSQILRVLERSLHKLGSTMILVSRSEMADAKDSVGRKRLKVIENAIDIAALPERHVKDCSVTRIGTAARITHQKEPWRFARLAQMTRSSASWLWIGGGPKESVDSWFKDSEVQITGWLSPEESLAMMASIDIYVSTSAHEGLPMSVIQAQALGIPCVLSAVDGHTDIIQDGVTGYLCQTDEEFIERINSLSQNRTLRLAMGKRAREAARARFSDDRLGKESISVYSGAE